MHKDHLKNLARSFLPPVGSRTARRMACHWWYRRQLRAAHVGFRRYGSAYRHSTLFVAGLPKSGSTWVKKMLTSYPGFEEITIPEATLFELEHGGSHDFNLPADMFRRFGKRLVVVRAHVHGSTHNRELLQAAAVPYVVLYRDLRDVAVSGYFYVSRTPWHPMYPKYVELDVEQGLMEFIRTHIRAYALWIQEWQAGRDRNLGLEVRYEDLLGDTCVWFSRIARHLGLDSSPSTIARIVEANSFERLSGGRSRGQADVDSFYRKGVAGDWRNHFSPLVAAAFYKELEGFDVELDGGR